MANFTLPRISNGGPGEGQFSQGGPIVPGQPTIPGDPRVNHIEDRIARQEKTTRSLLEEAVAIQRELESSFRLVEGTFGSERRGQQLLQDHIRTITTVLRRLNRDVEFLEEFKGRSYDQAKQLQQHVSHVERSSADAYNDLRRRLDLIESSIAKVAVESKNNVDGLALLRAQLEQRHLLLSDEMRKLGEKIDAVRTRQGHSDNEIRQYVRGLEGELFKRLQQVDARGSGIANELHSHIMAAKKEQDVERARVVDALSVRIESMGRTQGDSQTETNRRSDEQVASLKATMERMSADFKLQLEQFSREHDARLTDAASRMQEQRAWTERSVKRAQADVANGLSAVQESLQLSISVLDEKRRLMEEDIRSQLKKIMKTVVVI